MSEALLSSMIDKLNANERKMDELIERLEHAPNYTTTLSQIEKQSWCGSKCCSKFFFSQKRNEGAIR